MRVKMKDIHNDIFDKGTKDKLDIFTLYIKEWLPVFIYTPSIQYINIFDFFCGPGTDVEGNKGSPLIILDIIDSYVQQYKEKIKNKKIRLFFNDSNPTKIYSLQDKITPYKNNALYDIYITNENFSDIFWKQTDIMEKAGSANLLIIDPCGLKPIDKEILLKIIKIPRTDWILFIPSNFIYRFPDSPIIKKIFPNFSKQQLATINHKNIHRKIVEFYKRMLPEGYEYYIGKFSLRKEKSGNIYGLIFGTKHLLGIQKFLQVCWKKDPKRGEANFNIDDDLDVSLPIEDLQVTEKEKRFKKYLEEKIKNISNRIWENKEFDSYYQINYKVTIKQVIKNIKRGEYEVELKISFGVQTKFTPQLIRCLPSCIS